MLCSFLCSNQASLYYLKALSKIADHILNVVFQKKTPDSITCESSADQEWTIHT